MLFCKERNLKQKQVKLKSMTSIKLRTDNYNSASLFGNVRLCFIIIAITCTIVIFRNHSVLHATFSTELVVRTSNDDIELLDDKKVYYNDDDEQQSTITNTETTIVYQPGIHEEIIIDNMKSWGWDETDQNLVQSACTIYTDSTIQINNTTSIQKRIKKNPKSFQLSKSLKNYIKELEEYDEFVKQFTPVHDIRFFNGIRSQTNIHKHTNTNNHIDSICKKLKPSHAGLPGIFRSQGLSSIEKSTTGSSTSTSSAAATKTVIEYLEPLLPPLRHPNFCLKGDKHLFDMGYLIHDFESLCYKQIRTPTSRNVFIDMGASYSFHNMEVKDPSLIPSIHLINLFTKFGFPFDHIYGYEMTFNEPVDVYKTMPKQYHSALHWINIPVSTESTDYTFDNPLQLILDNFNEDDLIIVKLDIDTPSVEMSFIKQLLQYQVLLSSSTTGTTDTNVVNTNFTKYSKLIDHFYFEHHVVLKDLLPWWSGGGVDGSVSSSLQVYQQLRKQGIAAHYWP